MLLLQKTTARHLFLITLIALLVTLPSLFYGVFDAHDVKVHLLWSNGFSRQFWQGELYPRWLSESNAGLGSPSFFFYPPLPYYIASLFHPLFSGDSSGWLALASSACLSLVLSGMTAYLWLKEIAKESAALIGAIAYMLLPYHLTINLYLRFAFAEYWALVWLPLILYFLMRYIRGSEFSLIGIIIGYFLLSLTHLLTFIIFAFVPLFYTILVVNKQKLKFSFTILFSIFLGLGLSAIYWLPAMTTQDNISTHLLWQTKHFLYDRNFLFLFKPIDSINPFWSYLELLTLFMGAIAILSYLSIPYQHGRKNKQEISYWIFISLASIFMMTPFSQWVWDSANILQKIQFPWRFHSLLTLSSAATIALTFASLELAKLKNLKKPALIFVLILSLSLTSWISFLMYSVRDANLIVYRVFVFFGLALLPIFVAFFITKSWLKNRQILFAIAIGFLSIAVCLNGSWAIEQKFNLGLVFDDNINQPERLLEVLEFKRDPPEYRPMWFSEEIWRSDEEMKKLSQNIDSVKVISGQGRILIEQWKPRNITLEVAGKTNLFIKLRQFYYPGWSARIAKRDRSLSVYPDRGLLGIVIPQGQHRILVRLEAGREEQLGKIMSLISAILTLGLLRLQYTSIDKKLI